MASERKIAAPPGRGRPKISADDRRGKIVPVRFAPDEQAILDARVAESGLSVSAFIRRAALGLRIAPRRDPIPMEAVGQIRRLGNNVNQILREARFNNFPPHVADEAEKALKEVSAFLRSVFHDA